MADIYEKNSSKDWCWFEKVLTYDNAVLPYALFLAGLTFNDKRYRQIAEASCGFLLDNIFDGQHFSFIGCNGWYGQGAKKAKFDQQPIEAASTIMMLRAAYDATEDSRFLVTQRKAFDWFIGENDLHIPLYDFTTKGCCDGLMPGGLNTNQGAESTLSFLLGLMAILESYTIAEKNAETIGPLSRQNHLEKENTNIQKDGESMPITSLQAKKNSRKDCVEELK